MLCPVCGKELRENAKFCSACGSKVPAAEAQPEAPAQTESYQEPELPPPYQEPSQAPQYQEQPQSQKTALAQTAPEAPAVKKSHTLPLILTGVFWAAVIASFLLFVKPGFVMSKDDSSGKDKDSSSAAETESIGNDDDSTEAEADPSSAAVTTAPPESSLPEVTSAPETTAEKVTATETTTTEETTTSAAETTPKQTTKKTTAAPPETDTEDLDTILKEAEYFSTDQRPEFGEFEWCFGQNDLIREAPEGAEVITNPLGYSGGWKVMIIYTPQSSDEEYMRELDNFKIDIDGSNVTITVDWYQMEVAGNEIYDEQDMEDTTFTGAATDRGIFVTGAAEISITDLWKDYDKEYATGTIVTNDGTNAYLAMVRP